MNKVLCQFENTYAALPERFYSSVQPAVVAKPKLLQFNEALAAELGILNHSYSDEELAQIFSGQNILETSKPISMVYAGHQFGHFVPQLGDGRAILLGEVVNARGQRFDIQLKGAGVTPYSRRGDGKSAIGPVIREFIVSEAMFYLGVLTTRSLAAVSTGETVFREGPQPGGILTRVALSHIRVGHFEYFASRGDIEGLKILAQYTIDRLYPDIKSSRDKFFLFFQKVVQAQAALIAHWMDIGFIHGVMNTDNMLVSGETIDYGPCAFIDEFQFNQVFSSIDREGRYAYENQAPIAQWNLARLAECLLLLIEPDSKYAAQNEVVQKETTKVFENELSNFRTIFESQWLQRMRLKLGLLNEDPEDFELVRTWLEYLQTEKKDYTNSFSSLMHLLDSQMHLASAKASDSVTALVSAANMADNNLFAPTELFKNFEVKWRKRLAAQPFDIATIKNKMSQVNPIYIPRNHQVERAIRGVVAGDLTVFKELIQVLQKPFQEQPGFDEYKKAPREDERVTETFCGT